MGTTHLEAGSRLVYSFPPIHVCRECGIQDYRRAIVLVCDYGLYVREKPEFEATSLMEDLEAISRV